MNFLETNDYFILLALAEGAKHGGAVSAQIIGDSVGAVYLKPSSLYDSLKNLEKTKLIERTVSPVTKVYIPLNGERRAPAGGCGPYA